MKTPLLSKVIILLDGPTDDCFHKVRSHYYSKNFIKSVKICDSISSTNILEII